MEPQTLSDDYGNESESGPKEVGELVSEFKLPGAGADGIETFSLSEFTGEGALILSFYPFDFSPVCTKQLCAFQDTEWATDTENVDVAGISTDRAYAHQRLREEYGLPFPLLSDGVASVAERFGVEYDILDDHPSVCPRAVFAIDDTRTIRYRWHSTDAGDEPTPSELRDAISWVV